MDLSVLFLGTAGSVPTANRAPSSVLIRRGGDRILFDCGEGTQRQLLRSTGLIEVSEVFITHYHADHYLGLPGLLKTFDLQGREKPITIYGPEGLETLFGALRRIFGRVSYDLKLVELDPNEVLERDGYSVATFPTEHSVRSLGYALYESNRPGFFDMKKAKELGVQEGPDFGRLQRGEIVEVENRKVAPEDGLGEPRLGRKICISGDTAPCEATKVAAHGSSLLIHDASFGDDEKERASETGHSTASRAALLAKEAEVELLALTHLSTRYFGSEIKREARKVFPKTIVPNDFDGVVIPFPERGGPEVVSSDRAEDSDITDAEDTAKVSN